MSNLQTKPNKTRIDPMLIMVATLSILAIGLFIFKLIQLNIKSSSSVETDLIAYYDAGVRLAHGQFLYDPHFDLSKNQLIFIYPPLAAFAFVFAQSYVSTWWIWFAYSALCWFAGLRNILRELMPKLKEIIQRPIWWIVFLTALIVFLPVQVHLAWGQMQLLLFLLTTLAWLELRRGQETCAGLALGFGIAVKIYPIFFLVPLIMARRWRVVFVSLISSGILVLLSFALIGTQQTQLYIQRMLPAINELATGRLDTHAFSITLRIIIGDTAFVKALGTAFGLLIGAITILACLRWKISASGLLALGVTFFLLTTPVIWTHYFVLFYLPWLVAFAQSKLSERMILGIAYFLVATSTAIFYVPDEWVFAVHGLPMFGVLLLFITMLQQARTRRL